MTAGTGLNLPDLSAVNGSAAFNRMAGFEVAAADGAAEFHMSWARGRWSQPAKRFSIGA